MWVGGFCLTTYEVGRRLQAKHITMHYKSKQPQEEGRRVHTLLKQATTYTYDIEQKTNTHTWIACETSSNKEGAL